MAASFADRVWFNTVTTGTGTLNVGAALTGYQTPASAGVPSGATVGYCIVDGVNWEVGQGILASGSPWMLTRPAPEASSSGGGLISLSGSANVFLTLTAAQIAALIGQTPAAAKLSGIFTANGTLGSVPQGAMIIGASLQETAGHSVSVSLGTSSGGAQILSALTVPGNGIVPVPPSAMLALAWTAIQSVFVASASWNGASVTANVWYLQ